MLKSNCNEPIFTFFHKKRNFVEKWKYYKKTPKQYTSILGFTQYDAISWNRAKFCKNIVDQKLILVLAI